MRLFSNTLLTKQQTTFLFKASTIYSGRWNNNYYLYYINHRSPLIITTYSPLKYIQHDNKYYCYDEYGRDERLEKYMCSDMVSIKNKEPDFGTETYVFIPSMLNANDSIVINKEYKPSYPSAIIM